MAIFRAVSGSTRALLGLLIEAFSFYETVAKKIDVAWCWRMQEFDINKIDPSGNIDWYQNRRQKVVSRGSLCLCGGALRSCRGAWHSNLTKILLTYNVSYFNVGGLGTLFGGLSPPKPPLATGLIDTKQQSATTSYSTQIVTFSWHLCNRRDARVENHTHAKRNDY